jgi:membrane protein DedA with SNARE-associated domain
MAHTILQWITVHGYGVIVILFALGIFGLPLPNEWLLAYLGFLIFKGKLLPVPAFAAAFIGIFCGMVINYVLGRTFGIFLVHKLGKWTHLSEDKIRRVHEWFEHSGRWALSFGYFLPGVRHLTAFVAGTSKMAFSSFAIFSSLGGLVWSSSFITLGYFLEEKWSQETARIHRILGIASVTIITLLVIYLLAQKARRKGRAGGSGRPD